MKTRVGIIDDHPAMVLGLTAALNAHPSIHVVAGESTAEQLLDAENRLGQDSLDVVLLDLHLNDGSTPSQNISRLTPTGANVLVHTDGVDSRLLREAARSGAVGMARKSAPLTSLVRAVLFAARGEGLGDADWSRARGDDAPTRPRLTDREAEVLRRYAAGGTAESVGTALFVTRETVHDHIRRIRVKYAKAGREAPTKIDLLRRAIEDGLIDPDGQFC